jgi:N-acetylglucosamine-6-phosphate deacetylase
VEEDGFIDLHTHGFGRWDTKSSRPEQILGMAELQGRAGTAAILPTIYAGSVDTMRGQMEAVRQAMEVQRSTFDVQGPSWRKIKNLRTHTPSLILGVHLEGPFLNPARSGALDGESFLKPTLASLKRLVDGFDDVIRIITIAPEMPGALKLIEHCALSGIRVNMGHSDATYSEAADGKRAGAAGVTHLFNAMRPFHHREPGLAGFGLGDEDIFIEVIADGVHLHRETLRLIFRMKKHDKIILVSDSVKGAVTGGQRVYMKRGVLSGGGSSLADTARLLIKIGVPANAVAVAGMKNPKKYLG